MTSQAVRRHHLVALYGTVGTVPVKNRFVFDYRYYNVLYTFVRTHAGVLRIVRRTHKPQEQRKSSGKIWIFTMVSL